MNLTTTKSNSNNSILTQLKTRYVVALGGVALAASIAIGGAGALKLSNSSSDVGATAWLPTHALSVQPQFGTAADAEHAAQGLVAVQPELNTTADAERVARILIDGAAASWGEYAVPLASELTRQQVVQPLFANAADAEQAGNVAALESAFSVTPQGSFESIEDYAARERAALATLSNDTSARASGADIMASVISTERANFLAVEQTQPQFASAADAEYAARGLVQVAELPHPVVIQPMFGTAADAEYAAQALR